MEQIAKSLEALSIYTHTSIFTKLINKQVSYVFKKNVVFFGCDFLNYINNCIKDSKNHTYYKYV